MNRCIGGHREVVLKQQRFNLVLIHGIPPEERGEYFSLQVQFERLSKYNAACKLHDTKPLETLYGSFFCDPCRF